MSYVTSITVVVDYASAELRAALLASSDFGREEGYQTALRELNRDQAGGTKLTGHRVFAAGINYADREALRVWADALPWGVTNGVVLVSTEGDHAEAWVYADPVQPVNVTRVVTPR